MTDKIGANKEPAQFDEVAMGGKEDKKKSLENTDEGYNGLGERDETGNTPLHLACREGHLESVRLLLELKSPLELRNQEEETPLHVAVKGGHEAIVEVLLAAGASPVAKASAGRTVWHLAVLSGNANILKLLKSHTEQNGKLNSGATNNSSNLKSNEYTTVKDMGPGKIPEKSSKTSFSQKKFEVPLKVNEMDFGLRKDLPVSSKNASSILDWEEYDEVKIDESKFQERPRRIQNTTFVEIEGSKTMPSCYRFVNISKCSSIEIAAFNPEKLSEVVSKESAMIAMALNCASRSPEFNFRKTDENNCTALHIAAVTGAVLAVRTLIERGADVNAVNDNGFTPLHLAVIAGKKRIIRILSKSGVKLTDETKRLLLLAVGHYQTESVRELVSGELQLDPNLAGPGDVTPLMLTISCGEKSVSIAEILVKAGGNLLAENYVGLTALQMAQMVGNTELASYLSKCERKQNLSSFNKM